MKIIYHINHHTFKNIHTEIEYRHGTVYIKLFLTTVLDGYKVQTEVADYSVYTYKRLTQKTKAKFDTEFYLMQGKFLDCFLHYLGYYHATPIKKAEADIVW